MLAVGSDHGGLALKQAVLEHLDAQGIPYKDFGCYDTNSVDYPTIAAPVAHAIAAGEYEMGLLFCGTGIGMSLAANKVRGIRAALCENPFSARMAREHNDAHILCMGGRVLGPAIAIEMVDAFLHAQFQGDRHTGRVAAIMEIENS